MAQKGGIHRLLEYPSVYRVVQSFFSHEETHKAWSTLVGNIDGQVILDVGCGPGNRSVNYKNASKYIGIDISKKYIDSAKRNFSDYGDFYNISIEKLDLLPVKNFDLVILLAVIHHLDDRTISTFFNKIKSQLSDKGRIITLDTFFSDNYRLANFLASMDRGNFVRSEEQMDMVIPDYLRTRRKIVTLQKFPPYQRIMLELEHRDAP